MDIRAAHVRPGDRLYVTPRIGVTVIGVKANDYDVEEGVTLYVRGPDGLTDIYQYDHDDTVTVAR